MGARHIEQRATTMGMRSRSATEIGRMREVAQAQDRDKEKAASQQRKHGSVRGGINPDLQRQENFSALASQRSKPDASEHAALEGQSFIQNHPSFKRSLKEKSAGVEVQADEAESARDADHDDMRFMRQRNREVERAPIQFMNTRVIM